MPRKGNWRANGGFPKGGVVKLPYRAISNAGRMVADRKCHQRGGCMGVGGGGGDGQPLLQKARLYTEEHQRIRENVVT